MRSSSSNAKRILTRRDYHAHTHYIMYLSWRPVERILCRLQWNFWGPRRRRRKRGKKNVSPQYIIIGERCSITIYNIILKSSGSHRAYSLYDTIKGLISRQIWVDYILTRIFCSRAVSRPQFVSVFLSLTHTHNMPNACVLHSGQIIYARLVCVCG